MTNRFGDTKNVAGLISETVKPADNVYLQALSIAKEDREKLSGYKGRAIWFTGLSGAGKTTLANLLEVELHKQGKHTYLLDGDNIRLGLNKDLGFTDADRVENIRRIAEVTKLMVDANLIVMVAFISPFARDREMAKKLIGLKNFVEVFVDTSIEICEQRDPKGLYKKARDGKLPNFTGITSAYEPPICPDIIVNGSNIDGIESAIKKILDYLS